jgi:hypothetical protein
LGGPWKTLFEVAVALDGLRPVLPITSIVRDGKRVIRTTCPATNQRLSDMKELAGKPVEFRPINRTIGPQKYVLSGVPQDIPLEFIAKTFGVTEVTRLLKGDTPTRSVSFMTEKKPEDSFRIPLCGMLPVRPFVRDPPQCFRCHRWNHTAKHCRTRARCYHCGKQGPKEAGQHFVCCQRAGTPRCINCGGSHMAAYKGCPARKETVQYLQKRLGVQPRQRPPQAAVTAPAPWALKTKSPPQITTHRPSQIAPALLSETDFPTLQTKPHIQQQTTPVQTTQTTTQTDPTTATLTAILGHMQSIFMAMRSVQDLIQRLPKDLLAKAEKDLTKVQEEVGSSQVLDSILEVALGSAKTTPQTKPKPTKQHTPVKAKDSSGEISTSSPGTSEASTATKIA